MEKDYAKLTKQNHTVKIIENPPSHLYLFSLKIENDITGASQYPIKYDDGRIAYDSIPPKYVKRMVEFMGEVMRWLFIAYQWQESPYRFTVDLITPYPVRKFIIDNRLLEKLPSLNKSSRYTNRFME